MTLHHRMTSTHDQISAISKKNMANTPFHELTNSCSLASTAVSSLDRRAKPSLVQELRSGKSMVKTCELLKDNKADKINQTSVPEAQTIDEIKIKAPKGKKKARSSKSRKRTKKVELGKRTIDFGESEEKEPSEKKFSSPRKCIKGDKSKSRSQSRDEEKKSEVGSVLENDEEKERAIEIKNSEKSESEINGKEIASRNRKKKQTANRKSKKVLPLEKNEGVQQTNLSTSDLNLQLDGTQCDSDHNQTPSHDDKNNEAQVQVTSTAEGTWRSRLRSSHKQSKIEIKTPEPKQTPIKSAHENPLLHRDLKPSNSIIFDNEPTIAITETKTMEVETKDSSNDLAQPLTDYAKMTTETVGASCEENPLDTSSLTDCSEEVNYVQKIQNTPVGRNHQTPVLPFLLNSKERDHKRRIVKGTWNPEAVDQEELLKCFKEIEEITGQELTTEQNVLKNLSRFGMDLQKLVDNVKKNKLYYQNIMGTEQRVLRNRKAL